MRDPYGIRFWPEFKGRDGCRTPMVWNDKEANGGFSQAKPWLPVPAEHLAKAVGTQQGKDGSLLEHYRRFLAFRRAHRALVKGDIEFLDSPDDTVAFTRREGNEQMLCAFNLGHSPRTLELGGMGVLKPVPGHGFGGRRDGATITFDGYQAWFAYIP